MTLNRFIAERQIAVLIDYENTGLKSLQWLFDQISDVGRVIVKRAYADWTASGDKRDELLELGIEAIHLFRSGNGTKNSSDIRLVIDALELLHQSPIDTFVIVSSDSDFAPLVSKLRASGKTVIGAGRKAVASRTLVISCDKYYYLEQGDEKQLPTNHLSKEENRTPIEMLLSRAVHSAMDEQGKVTGSKLCETMQRLEPSFDYHPLGYSTFTKFIESYSSLKITRPKKTGDISIELAVTSVPVSTEPTRIENWDIEIDKVWAKKAIESGKPIPGPTAASDAAKVLKVTKLSASPHKTLQKLLEASDLLNNKWKRDKNSILKK